jgi:hypothetical protein
LIEVAVSLTIVRKPSTNCGEWVASAGRRKASMKIKGSWSDQLMVNSRKPASPSQPAAFPCRAYSPTMPSGKRIAITVFRDWMTTHVSVVTDGRKSGGWIG